VLLNGSVLGYIRRVNKTLEYEELASYPMTVPEIDSMVTGITQLVKNGIEELILFFYTRDWKEGETIWTPSSSRMDGLKKKYMSASQVVATPVDELREILMRKEVCMTSLLIDRPEDTLMAYQHSRRNNFFTRQGVDKAFGVREIAKRFDLSLNDSFGAGDTEMDNFLSEMGLAIVVGGAPLPYQGKHQTMRVADPLELGETIKQFALLAQSKSSR
jgi:hydroxymethylpyrimidine pyrophosphatase-like HAD family hydrolase